MAKSFPSSTSSPRTAWSVIENGVNRLPQDHTTTSQMSYPATQPMHISVAVHLGWHSLMVKHTRGQEKLASYEKERDRGEKKRGVGVGGGLDILRMPPELRNY